MRPLVRRRFVDPCWLQSHLQSLPIESLPIVSDEAVSRRDVVPDAPALLSVVDGEVEVEPLSVVVLLDVSERGVFLSAVEVGSVLVALLVESD